MERRHYQKDHDVLVNWYTPRGRTSFHNVSSGRRHRSAEEKAEVDPDRETAEAAS
jgi:hypothetical protein